MAKVAATQGAHDPGVAGRTPLADLPRGRGLTAAWATVIVAVVGLVITVTVSWTAWTLNRHNEHRLLELQSRQAVAVVSAAIPSLQGSLETALQVEIATAGSIQQFNQFASTYVGPKRPFVSVALWKTAEPPGGPLRSSEPTR